MKNFLLLITICIGLSIFFYPTISNSNSTGSPGGKTGSPMDGDNCTQCHIGTINSGAGITSIATNIPSSGYVPGNVYLITTDIQETGILTFGFEISAEAVIGATQLTKTGSFMVTNSNETQFANNNTAITHTAGGTSGFNSRTWSMDWEAPAAGTGDVTFYAAVMASNSSTNNNGDNVYTHEISFIEASAPTASWDCDPTTGVCFDPGTGLGQYATLTACQMVCTTAPSSWDCDPTTGVCFDPGAGMGLYPTQTVCQNSCWLQTWDCVGNACIDPTTGQGAHPTLADCQNNCNITPTWNCDGQGNCSDPGTGLGWFSTFALCQASCTPSWDCDPTTGICFDPGTGQGLYPSLPDCQLSCIVATLSWDCDPSTGICSDPGTGLGAYTDLITCQAACIIGTPSWDCDPSTGICSDPGTGQGAYTDFITCQAACITAINEEISNLLIYPNPIKNTLTIDGKYTSLTIYNVFGKAVLITDYQNTIDVASLRNGVYFIHINTNNSSAVKKITIAK